MNSNNSKYYY